MPADSSLSPQAPRQLSRGACITILVVAFMGWFFGGMQILVTNLAMRSASIDMMDKVGWLDADAYAELNRQAGELEEGSAEQKQLTTWNALAARWHAWFQVVFLFGAAAGGYIFGRLGDRMGRTRALGIAITWFSVFTGFAYFAQTPIQLLILRFLLVLGSVGPGLMESPSFPKSGRIPRDRFCRARSGWRAISGYSPCPLWPKSIPSIPIPGTGSWW